MSAVSYARNSYGVQGQGHLYRCRRPRLKTRVQVIAEFEALKKQKMDLVFVVDDNFIGNKKAIKLILRDIIDWQRKRGYPLSFFTEATLDLAEDEQLMKPMGEAGFLSVFIGIETPNEEALKETRKTQNISLMKDIYDTDAYFDRIDGLLLDQRFKYAINAAMHYHYYTLAQGSTSLGRTGVVTSW